MKKLPRVALYGAGSLSASPLLSIEGLAIRLGPVQSSSLRVASRLANSLRAGYAVSGFRDFEECPLVLISVPDQALPSAIADLLNAPFDWTGRVALLCSNVLGAAELAPLVSRGATAGSLAFVPGFESRWVVIEGNRELIRQTEPYISKGIRLTSISPDSKPAFIQALFEANPTVVRVLDRLRELGVPRADAGAMLERVLERAVRSYVRSGKPK